MSQIVALIELSEYCSQSFHYECMLAPLEKEGKDFAFWEDRNGDINNYFTGTFQSMIYDENISDV